MNIKEQIRAEIERRRNAWLEKSRLIKKGRDAAMYAAGKSSAYAEFLSYIDSLPEQPVSDHHEIEVEFRGEKVTISREFYRNGERNYSTSEQDDNAIWSALRAWCEKKGITPFELYPKQPEQPDGLEEAAKKSASQYYVDGGYSPFPNVEKAAYEAGFIAGAEWQKAKMLEDAAKI